MKAELGRYRMRGFSMFKKIPHWDELIFLPGTLTRFVIEGYREKCVTKTVLGARFAKKPIELDIPVYITGMSFGALSIEAKMALAKGASMAGTATCSGEGGMIPPERDLSTKWYYQIIQSRYGFNPHHLMLADAVEFFIGQGCKVGLGGHLMGQKVTEQVAEMRSLPAGIDQRSPARHPDWLGPDDLSLKVQETREATNYEIPIQLKLGAARVYDDVRMAAKCGPDIIYLDGAEGGTGAGPHTAAEETGIPLMAAIPEARRALEDVGPGRRDRPRGRRRHPQRRRRGEVHRAGRRRDRDRPLGADGAQLQQGDPGRHRLRGHDRRARPGSATTATPAAARSGSRPRTRSCASGSTSRRRPTASTTSSTRSRSRCRCSRARAARPTCTRSSPRTWPRSPPRPRRWRACRWRAPTTSRA